MAWTPPLRNPTDRDVRIEMHGEQLRVELMRGGRLFACRSFSRAGIREALALGERWLVMGPVIVHLEREPLKVAA